MKYDYKQIAKCKINNKNYEVLLVNNEYYQVRCNRNKISNHNSEKAAVKRMFAEANYENTSIFDEEQQAKETEKDEYTSSNKIEFWIPQKQEHENEK